MAQQDPIYEDGVPTQTYLQVAPDHSHTDLLNELHALWEMARDFGDARTPEEICAEHPDQLSALKKLIAELSPHNRHAGNAATLTADPAPAVIVARPLPAIPGYTIERELGHGGMGEVYLARDADGHLFALKMIRADRVGAVYLERFLREKTALLELYHPNVVRIYFACKTDDGSPYFTMPYCERGTLADRLTEFQADPHKAVALMIKVAEAVEYLHKQGRIHRDLKPQNILLGENDEPFVSDFGLVKDFDLPASDEAVLDYQLAPSTDDGNSRAETQPHATCSARLTRTAGIIGTMPYMSPEQLQQHKEPIGPQSDIWALGVILYELLCGVRPFQADTPEAVSQLIRNRAPIAPRAFKPEVDRDLEVIILKCLERKPELRFRDAKELTEALAAWQNEQSLLPESNRPFSGQGKRSRLYPFGIACVAVFAIGGIGWIALPQGDALKVRDQESELSRILADYAASGEVDLFNQQGSLRWSRWLAGADQPIVGNRSIEFANSSVSLLELMRGVPTGYRFECEIEHMPGTGGIVGIYVGRSVQPSQTGPLHCMILLRISDVGPFAPNDRNMGAVTIAAAGCATDTPTGFASSPTVENGRIQKPVGNKRRIKIDFTTETLTICVDAHRFKPIARNLMMRYATGIGNARPKELQALTPTFQPDEGVGLFVHGGGIRLTQARLVKP